MLRPSSPRRLIPNGVFFSSDTTVPAGSTTVVPQIEPSDSLTIPFSPASQ